MKKSQKQTSQWGTALQSVNKKYALFALAALVLVSGSFTLASGTVSINGNALLADVYSAITGRPMLVISRDSGSPYGLMPMGTRNTLAIFDVSVKNATHWATVNSVPLQMVISQSFASPLALTDFSLRYDYCIPSGAMYGYGYRSGGCASTTLYPSSVSRNGNTYYVNFYSGIQVYPQESSGTLTVLGASSYAYTADARNGLSSNATLTVQMSGINASADQCLWTYGFVNEIHNYGYSYTGCVSYPVIPNVTSAYGNTLTVIRPYGYGYNARVTSTVMPMPLPTKRYPATTTYTGGQNQANQVQIQQLQALIAVLLQQITALMKARGQ